MTFPLTAAGRDNLEAILVEFERASRYYPPLYHEELIAWSDSGEVDISESGWQAFIDAQQNELGADHEWSEWHGPHFESPGFGVLCLGRWCGDPKGLPEFINLAESLIAVLRREDFSSADIPHSFESWLGWLTTIHYWAFTYQLPLLSVDQSLWGIDVASVEEFDEYLEKLCGTDENAWPQHPLCWRLNYNVFTSSAAAIRAILRAGNVISLNEPWPYSTSLKETGTTGDFDTVRPESSHVIRWASMGWHIHFAGTTGPLFCPYQAGLNIIATLIQYSGHIFRASELCGYGGRSRSRYGNAHSIKKHFLEDGLTTGPAFSRQEKDDEEARRSLQKRLQELHTDREEALRSGDPSADSIVAEIDDEFEQISKQFNIGKDLKVKRQRTFTDPQEKKAYDSVAKNLRNFFAGIKELWPDQHHCIEELEVQIKLPKLVFEPMEQFVPWRVC